MFALKKLRKSRRLSPKQLAKVLDIEVKEFNKWEKNPNLIPQKKLSQLAYSFDLDSDELKIWLADDSSPINTSKDYVGLNKDIEDGFWGNLGIKLTGQSKSLWFPITLATVKYLDNALINTQSNEDWITLDTLNNRSLAIKPALVSRIYLLDENQSPIEDDWEILLDNYTGKSGEFYKALEDIDSDSMCFHGEIELCDSVKLDVEKFINQHDLGFDQVSEMVEYTHVYTLDGEMFSQLINRNLSNIYSDIECEYLPTMLELSSDEIDLYIPSAKVCLIDMPKRKLRAEMKLLHKEFEGES